MCVIISSESLRLEELGRQIAMASETEYDSDDNAIDDDGDSSVTEYESVTESDDDEQILDRVRRYQLFHELMDVLHHIEQDVGDIIWTYGRDAVPRELDFERLVSFLGNAEYTESLRIALGGIKYGEFVGDVQYLLNIDNSERPEVVREFDLRLRAIRNIVGHR